LKRHSSTQRRQARHQKFLLLALLAVSAVTAFVVCLTTNPFSLMSGANDAQWVKVSETDDSWLTRFIFDPAAPSKSTREVYPYSVVPGGVLTKEELREASAHDPVVAEHYNGFDFQKARVINLRQAKLVYLSYRIGDKVYWTTKKVALHAGEKLITDGKITARTRCANQVSVLPQKKSSPEEPSVSELDNPVDGSSTKVPFPDNFHSALESRPAPGLPAPGLAPSAVALASRYDPLTSGFLPLGSPLSPGARCTGTGCGKTPNPGPGPNPNPTPGPNPNPAPGPGPGPGPNPAPGPTSVPEPATLEFIAAELAALLMGWKFARLTRS
jgi:hypothetical protein